MPFGPLVSAEWLREHLGEPDLRVVDFRWHLQGPNGLDEYRQGHIPGAVFIDLEWVTGTEGGGRHPLPTSAQFEAELQMAGITSESRVVVYDDAGGSIAARLWFLLGWFGHDRQAVLDGGLQAWAASLDTAVPPLAPGNFLAREPDRSRILDFEAVRQLEGVALIDARAGERYRGEKEPVDPKAGHIPGALSAPFRENLGPDGRFKSPAEQRQSYSHRGVESEAVVYCGSGVNACHAILAMELAGLRNVRLYAGSWSDWSDRDAPVATGQDP